MTPNFENEMTKPSNHLDFDILLKRKIVHPHDLNKKSRTFLLALHMLNTKVRCSMTSQRSLLRLCHILSDPQSLLYRASNMTHKVLEIIPVHPY